MKRFLLLLSIVVCLSACGSQGELKGNVFIVTKGSQNFKLGLVEVRAISEDKMAAYVASRQPVVAQRHAQLLKEYNQANADYQAALKEAQSANASYNAEARSGSEELGDYDTSTMSYSELLAARDRMQSLRDRVGEYRDAAQEKLSQAEAAEKRLTAAENKLKDTPDAKLYFDNLPQGVTQAITNADGDFSLKLPIKGRFALVARAQRDVIGKTEEYYWLVWVALDGQPSKTVLLSNQNLADAGSPDSVISPIKDSFGQL